MLFNVSCTKKLGLSIVNELHSMKWLNTPLEIESSLQSFSEGLLPEQVEKNILIVMEKFSLIVANNR